MKKILYTRRRLLMLELGACLIILFLLTACTFAALGKIPAVEVTQSISKTEIKEVSGMAEEVTAEVILRSADGSSILEAKGPITSENVAKYRVEKEVIDEASRKLEGLGFQIEQTGPTSITISGGKALFERVFQTTLKAKSKDVMGTKVEGAEVSYYEAAEPIVVPKDLTSLIAGVVLPTPPEFFP